jgi:hypothetical protein
VEVTELTTRAAESKMLSVDDCRLVFKTIEMRKAEVQELTERVLKTMGRLVDEINLKTSLQLIQATHAASEVKAFSAPVEEFQMIDEPALIVEEPEEE